MPGQFQKQVFKSWRTDLAITQTEAQLFQALDRLRYIVGKQLIMSIHQLNILRQLFRAGDRRPGGSVGGAGE